MKIYKSLVTLLKLCPIIIILFILANIANANDNKIRDYKLTDYKLTELNLGTEVGGLIESDTIWSKSGSPYIAKSNIVVDEGATLTINEGVEVLFGGNYSLQVAGRLIAKGTIKGNIIFDNLDNNANSFNKWNNIEFRSDNNVIEYAILRNSKNSWNGVIHIEESSNNQILNNLIYNNIKAIQIEDYSNNNKILYNTIIDNSQGIDMEYAFDNKSDNHEIKYNNIYNNYAYNLLLGNAYSWTPNAFVITENYWGTDDRKLIESKLKDYSSDFNKIRAIYEPFLLSPFGLDLVNSNYSSGIYNNPLLIELSVLGEGFSIYYTLDNSDPREKGILYTEPIVINSTSNLKTVSFKDNIYSEVVNYAYVIEFQGIIGGNISGISDIMDVEIYLGNYKTETDANGYFKFENIPFGFYELKADYPLSKSEVVKVEIASSDIVHRNLKLTPGDLNNDNYIDLIDLVILSRNYGR